MLAVRAADTRARPQSRRIVDLGGQKKRFGTRPTAAPSTSTAAAKERARRT
jgi:hypothetical protein